MINKYKTAIFVNGCFWHQHPNCIKAKMPSSNHEYWQKKLRATTVRDQKSINALIDMGWRVIIVWECELKNEIEKVVSNLDMEIKTKY